MNRATKKLCWCRLCGGQFEDHEMSEEHYPARNTGNDDIVKVNLVEMIDLMMDGNFMADIYKRYESGEKFADIADDIFDNRLAEPLYPKGRTARTLCRTCNTFLGKYDEAYLRFFEKDGDPQKTKGFQQKTKLQIVKAIYAKFLSIPETQEEQFDFLEFVRNEQVTTYEGVWKIYFVKRDMSTDFMGMQDIRTGRGTYSKGIVYELSDTKFIFNLMNFPKDDCIVMTDIFDVLKKDYKLVTGLGAGGGYHAEIFVPSLLSGES